MEPDALMSINDRGHVVIEPARSETRRNSIAAPQPRVYDKNSELEKIKRQLYNLIDRIEQLKSK